MSTSQDQKLSRGALIALVVGSMIGSGIFALPSAFGRSTGGLGALIAWAIAGTGMLMLALVFQTLSMRRPDLDTGIYAYAKAGFGNYLGFASAVGYWIGCCLADVACLVLIKATLGQFFPVFGDGSTADEDLREALRAARAARGGDAPAGALVFSCNGRGTRMFAAPDHDAAAIRDELGDVPAAGLFCNGEIGPVGGRSFLHGFTATMVLFGAGGPSGGET